MTKKDKYDRISEKKMSTPIDVLCKGLPQEFATYMQYCRSLRFDDKPDYYYLRRLFRELFQKKGYQYDFVWDWCYQDKKKTSSSSSSGAAGAAGAAGAGGAAGAAGAGAGVGAGGDDYVDASGGGAAGNGGAGAGVGGAGTGGVNLNNNNNQLSLPTGGGGGGAGGDAASMGVAGGEEDFKADGGTVKLPTFSFSSSSWVLFFSPLVVVVE